MAAVYRGKLGGRGVVEERDGLVLVFLPGVRMSLEGVVGVVAEGVEVVGGGEGDAGDGADETDRVGKNVKVGKVEEAKVDVDEYATGGVGGDGKRLVWLGYDAASPHALCRSFREVRRAATQRLLVRVDPEGPLWYLPNLIGMRLIAPWWMQLRWPLFWAVVLQICILNLKEIVYDVNLSFLDMNSMLSFFPFYVSGVVARRSSYALNAILDWKGSWRAALTASLTFLGFCYTSCANSLDKHWFGIYAEASHKHEWFNWNTGRFTACFQSVLGTKELAVRLVHRRRRQLCQICHGLRHRRPLFKTRQSRS